MVNIWERHLLPTDRENSKYSIISKSLKPRRARWPQELTAFHFKILTDLNLPTQAQTPYLSTTMPIHRRGIDSPRADTAAFQADHSEVCDERPPLTRPPIMRLDAVSLHRNAYSAICLGSRSADSAACKAVDSAACEDHRPPHGSRRERHDDTRDHRCATRLARGPTRAWARSGACHQAVRTCVGQQHLGARAKRFRRTRESAGDDRK